MTKNFSKISQIIEFDRDLKKLLKRFRSLEEDLETFQKGQLYLYHKLKVDNGGIVQINNLGIESPQIFKVVKFACKSIHGRGVASGIRLTYAYYEQEDHVEYIQIYFKADQENEDRERIKSFYGRL